MKTKLTILALLLTVTSLLAAPADYVSARATGTTSASVYFEPSPNFARLVVADVTSDKAASVLSWQLGNTNGTLLNAATSTDTNLLITLTTVASNAALLSVTAAGTVTAHTAFTNTPVTNVTVTLENTLSTNVARGSIAREVTSTTITIDAASSTNVVSITAANYTNALAVGTNFLFEGDPGVVITNQVASWVTNGSSFDLTLSNNWSFVPKRAYVLTSTVYPVMLPSLASANSVVLSNSVGLIATDKLAILPTGGGAILRDIQSTNTLRWTWLTIKAATGVALGVGDNVYVLDTAQTTPVGAATVRLFADPLRVLPPNVPAVLTVDGTSAVTINSATVRYK